MQVKIKNMKNEIPTVLFVCEHGSAKSTIAAEHFNKLARERNLQIQAISRGTNPDSTFPDNIIEGLQADGLTIGEPNPQKLNLKEVANAVRIVTFCQIPAEYATDFAIEDWGDVPPVSEDYEKSRDEIVKRVKLILDDIQ
jgi:arsenate reductase (thioredoxin)